ncbi:hypothetical protein PanWU01x14_249710 [Parasponia andersonii]|uniref:Uncharacterized protein n=1 Tax=Parasponia andersonii TaxID=3476 RepID=A0A2P5BD10_PARAD|nr:hypothetical protein PanWU01x14_249710 [Parasponia andersonii]
MRSHNPFQPTKHFPTYEYHRKLYLIIIITTTTTTTTTTTISDFLVCNAVNFGQFFHYSGFPLLVHLENWGVNAVTQQQPPEDVAHTAPASPEHHHRILRHRHLHGQVGGRDRLVNRVTGWRARVDPARDPRSVRNCMLHGVYMYMVYSIVSEIKQIN